MRGPLDESVAAVSRSHGINWAIMSALMLELVRAGDWWQYKLAPTVALFFATALIERNALLPLWPQAALLLVALAVCAAYVSVINDLTDRADDVAGGKPNRQLAYSRGPVLALLGSTIAAGSVIAWSWRGEPLLVATYAGSWLVYSLYSLPPLRLKARGLAGAVCDAAGAHLFPALTAILLASGSHRPDRVWMAAAAVWAFAYGLRGIVWHQLNDYRCDVRAGVQTFAARWPAAATRLGTFVAFPAELVALAILLRWIAEPLPLVALVFYTVLLAGRARKGLTLVVVMPKPHCISVMQEYYDVFLPVALLLGAVERDWHTLVLLAAYIGLFPKGLNRVARDVTRFALILRDAGRVPRARTPL
jgi:hypothetical protein